MTGRTGGNGSTQAQPERVMLVGVMLDKDGTGSSAARLNGFQTALAEAVELVKAAGGDSVRVETAKRDRPHTALFVGTGKAAELSEAVAADGIDLVVFNHELTPTQERNLEKELKCRVLDRVGLILAIFARRARTQEGRLQVELAQLSHLAGRLIRGYGHLQSQRGGIGMKGPGETKLETDRRLIAHRINALKKQLANLKKQRALRRKSRESGTIKTFALVGYTNVGKSSLFNRLTKSGIYAKDQLFATLDTTARRLYISPECSIILTDTVGFVSDLPHKLISAFSATLEETAKPMCCCTSSMPPLRTADSRLKTWKTYCKKSMPAIFRASRCTTKPTCCRLKNKTRAYGATLREKLPPSAFPLLKIPV
ncbi:GTP-binding protein [Neisseria meningitidis]|nr:GTPase HflX [Neisseria meningitidis]CKK83953.1 GTP-binding protein [Neisseria meningitidis]